MDQQQQNPYAATHLVLNEPGPSEELELADRGVRLGAVVIDILCFAGIGILMAIFIPMFGKGGGKAAAAIIGLLMGGAFLALLIYNLVLIHRNGQTIGKRLLKIKVVRSDGSRCSVARYFFMRYLITAILGAIPFLGVVISLVDPLLIFRESRKCLHDEIADTIVVKA
ncbi:Uncharacterized membrane protein YckC, RDD family [Formivibrio citricus]|uniref:Uncharacterized membrane protein YckC, RDD family n=1 Tax=Formivibrio citricus TaxID=83765 RepID=A0A1I4ZBZ6_9NEIS|nr:RDD family protein [Formivibrio citricus]SFN47812.1 Uncharacterized membrane protein YckC, RDD family [Formivibrio citricus]